MKPFDIMALAGGITANLHDQNVSSATGSPTVATARYDVNNTGLVDQIINGGAPTTLETWLPAGNVNSQYSVFAHVNSGTAPSGDALDVETVLTASKGWFLSQGPAIGTKTCNLNVQIRDALTHQILASAIITITADCS